MCRRSARLGLAIGGRQRMRRAGDSWLSSPAALAVNSGSLERLASLGDAEMREPDPRRPVGASLVRADTWSAPRDRLRCREPGSRTVWPTPKTPRKRRIGRLDRPLPADRLVAGPAPLTRPARARSAWLGHGYTGLWL